MWDVDGNVFCHLQDLVEPDEKTDDFILFNLNSVSSHLLKSVQGRVMISAEFMKPTLYSTALLGGCRL